MDNLLNSVLTELFSSAELKTWNLNSQNGITCIKLSFRGEVSATYDFDKYGINCFKRLSPSQYRRSQSRLLKFKNKQNLAGTDYHEYNSQNSILQDKLSCDSTDHSSKIQHVSSKAVINTLDSCSISESSLSYASTHTLVNESLCYMPDQPDVYSYDHMNIEHSELTHQATIASTCYEIKELQEADMSIPVWDVFGIELEIKKYITRGKLFKYSPHECEMESCKNTLDQDFYWFKKKLCICTKCWRMILNDDVHNRNGNHINDRQFTNLLIINSRKIQVYKTRVFLNNDLSELW